MYGSDDSELYIGKVSADDYEPIDSVISQGLWGAGMEALTHDDFAKVKDDGGCARWNAGVAE